MMKYQIVNGQDKSELEAQVNELIEEGWTPSGGLIIDEPRRDMRYFYQAMVKQ